MSDVAGSDVIRMMFERLLQHIDDFHGIAFVFHLSSLVQRTEEFSRLFLSTNTRRLLAELASRTFGNGDRVVAIHSGRVFSTVHQGLAPASKIQEVQ